MKKFFIYLILISIIYSNEKEKFWIYFKSKEIIQSPKISTRAIERRKKISSELFSFEDYEVSPRGIEILKNKNIEVVNKSNWLNAVTAFLTLDEIEFLENEKEIVKIEKVAKFAKSREEFQIIPQIQKFQKSNSDLLDYGASYNQLKQINVVDVHNLRVNGKGILVGMLDSGFRWKIHEATKNLKIIAEYDFIQKDSVTAFQNGDSPDQDHHGTTTMSALGGYFPGKLIGPAFKSEFILGKTEYVPTETNIEEDNWVAGIEWMEKMGVDVVSSSLGYSLFDAGQMSYSYSNMDGKTATTSKAAVIAAKKGIVVCTAMGNEGNNSWGYLVSPADADSIISVGAVNSSGTKTGFSSYGPTSDGRIKPDLCALGSGVYSANASYVYPGAENIYGYNSGTSLSTPLVAGVSAVLLSAFPELTPIQVRNALRTTASKSNSPDTLIGWGVVNLLEATHSIGIVISPDPEINYTSSSNYKINFYISSSNAIKKDSIFLYYSKNKKNEFKAISMLLENTINPNLNSGKYSATIPREVSDITIEFFASAKDEKQRERKSPYNAPLNSYSIPSIPMNVEEEIIPNKFLLSQNYPNPFNNETVINYQIATDEFVEIKIFDLLGRNISQIVNEKKSAGVYKIKFNGENLQSGVYFYQIKAGQYSETKKLLLLK